jgi:hypothetical protein
MAPEFVDAILRDQTIHRFNEIGIKILSYYHVQVTGPQTSEELHHFFRRSVVKKIIMTKSYGLTKFGLFDKIKESNLGIQSKEELNNLANSLVFFSRMMKSNLFFFGVSIESIR